MSYGAVHNVRNAILDQFLPPPPVTLCHTSQYPFKVHHTSWTPRFLVVHAYIHMSLQGVCLSSRGVLFREFCLGLFVWKVLSGVVFVHPPSVIIHLLQQKAKHHFQ